MAARRSRTASRKQRSKKTSASRTRPRAKKAPRAKTRTRAKKSTRAKRAVKARRAPARRPAKPAAARAAAKPPAAADVMRLDAPNGRPAASGIGVTHHHMDFTSHDVEGVRRFYAETLGFSNQLYMDPPGYLTVFVSPRSSLGFMRPAPGAPPESWSPPGEPSLYLFVEDVDRAHRRLVDAGVSFDQEPQDMPWGHRMAVFRDPEGRRVCIAKDLKR